MASSGDASGTLTATDTNTVSVTLTVPASGLVMVTARATFKGNQSGTFVVWRITQGGVGKDGGWWDAGDADGYYDQTQQTFMLVQVPNPGTYTYTLQLSEQGGGTAFANYILARISATYIR